MVELMPSLTEPLLRRASVAVAEVIRDAILAGDLEVGSRVKEEELAAGLGVSRTPVREALLILAAESLVDLPANRGARPTVHAFSDEELDTISELRVMVEPYTTGRAAPLLSSTIIAELEASCQRFAAAEAGDAKALVNENRHFHRLIVEGTGSERLLLIVDGLLQIPLAYKLEAWSDRGYQRRAVAGHKRILKALKARDSEGSAAAMRQHLTEALPNRKP